MANPSQNTNTLDVAKTRALAVIANSLDKLANKSSGSSSVAEALYQLCAVVDDNAQPVLNADQRRERTEEVLNCVKDFIGDDAGVTIEFIGYRLELGRLKAREEWRKKRGAEVNHV